MRKEGLSNHISSFVRLLVQKTASRRLAKVFKDFKLMQTIFSGHLMYLIQVNVVLFIVFLATMYFLSSVHWLHPFQNCTCLDSQHNTNCTTGYNRTLKPLKHSVVSAWLSDFCLVFASCRAIICSYSITGIVIAQL